MRSYAATFNQSKGNIYLLKSYSIKNIIFNLRKAIENIHKYQATSKDFVSRLKRKCYLRA